jgi:hemolysin III
MPTPRQPSLPAHVAAGPVDAPRLRGWIHASAAPLSAIVPIALWRAASPGLPRVSVAVFGLGLVALFATSGAYHVPRWPARVRYWWSRADVAMIQLFIAASFTPIAVHALQGAWRWGSLLVAWSIAVVGAIVAASPIRASRWLVVVAYAGFASLAVVPLARIIEVMPPTGLALIAAGGILYLVGGVVYARRIPDPWPRTFGFHEVFHVLVVAGVAFHVAALWGFTLPLA